MRRLLAHVRSERSLAAAAALACYCAAIVLAPSGVRSQFDAGRRTVVASPSARPLTPIAAVVPRGDAFAPRAVVEEDRPATIVPAAPPGLAGIARPRPDAAARDRVSAIAIGSRPTAVVVSAGGAQIVTIGDPLGGSTITAIDASSITLRNGTRLSLEPGPDAP